MTVREKIEAGEYKAKADYINIQDKVARVEAKKRYWAEVSRLNEKFKADLEEEHGVVGHPKADQLFSLAYSHGHSLGHDEVVCWYEELVDLIK